MNRAVILIPLMLFGCATPDRILKKYGNDYSYGMMSGARIYYCKPVVKSATAVFRDNTELFDHTKTETDESADIGKSFFEYLTSEVRAKALPWQLLGDTSAGASLIMSTDSGGGISMKPERFLPLAEQGVDYLIVIYDILSAHEQSTYMQYQASTKIASQGSSNRIEFNYRCAIVDVKKRKAIMHVSMHEASSNSLNFYDKVCKHLFDVILYSR